MRAARRGALVEASIIWPALRQTEGGLARALCVLSVLAQSGEVFITLVHIDRRGVRPGCDATRAIEAQ